MTFGEVALVAISGDYNDLVNKPNIEEMIIEGINENVVIPENVSVFNNDAGYITNEDIEDLASKTYVSEEIVKAMTEGQVDLTAYVQKRELSNVAYSGDYNSLSNLPDLEAVDAEIAKKANRTELAEVSFTGDYNDLINVPAIPEFADYATKTYVDETVATAITGGQIDLTGYAKTADLSSVATSGLYADLLGKPDLTVYALKTEIPSTSGLATETYVDEAIANIDIPTVDLTDYATKVYVDEAIAAVVPEDVDLSNYYTKSEVDTAISTAASAIVVPTKLSELSNDTGFTTLSVVRSLGYTTMSSVEAKGYQTAAQVNVLIANYINGLSGDNTE